MTATKRSVSKVTLDPKLTEPVAKVTKAMRTAESVVRAVEGLRYTVVMRDATSERVDAEPMITRSTKQAAGYDLHASGNGIIPARSSLIVNTGVTIEISSDKCALIKGRSGLAFNHDIVAFNGVIDPDFKGEIKVKLFNHGNSDFIIGKNDRIAQIVVVPVSHDMMMEVGQLPSSRSTTATTNAGNQRTGGFGSTGA
jgi:dUTP pyrophosphatase